MGKEPGQYLDGNAEGRDANCYRRGALESCKAKGFGDRFGRDIARAIFGWKRGETGSELL